MNIKQSAFGPTSEHHTKTVLGAEVEDPMPNDHRIELVVCPFCTVIHDGALNLDDEEAPKDGDANVCGRCTRLSIYDFTAPGGLRLPTPEEHTELIGLPEVQRAIMSATKVRWTIQRSRALVN